MVTPHQKPCRFDVFLVNLDPTQGAGICKTRPCVIISPDEMNHTLATVIVAPMTTTIRSYPTRVSLLFSDKKGQISLDQMRTLDQNRLVKKLGVIPNAQKKKIFQILHHMFSE
ncbi:MAG: type II toxin-antitoxin system PemK/MazF family toxin [Alphaproteobacteria bacterium]|nr:type II toxin-antitoxin system PemK/MazF family toxin [Alphaproteobacteria bacterium]